MVTMATVGIVFDFDLLAGTFGAKTKGQSSDM